MFNTRSTSSGIRYAKATVNGVNGAVFLPAAGYRYGKSANYVGSYGYYWSSSTQFDCDGAYSVLFSDNGFCSGSGFDRKVFGYLDADYWSGRLDGYSVRLVTLAEN